MCMHCKRPAKNNIGLIQSIPFLNDYMNRFTFEQVICAFIAVGAPSNTWTVATNSLPVMRSNILYNFSGMS